MTTLLDRPARTAEPPAAGPPPPGRLRRLMRGPAAQAAYIRPAALVMLVGTAFLYLWNLTASGYGNSFYAAAELAGTQSWKAWLFGSLDAGNAITVDKPPGALWVATAFARVFGFNSFTVLAPQAFMGIAAVGLLYLTVKRVAGPVAGLVAGSALALTPVAVLMFRFNNPDALLVLLMVTAAYFVVRALERASARWLMLAGVAVGFAFLTKMGQAFLVLPGFGLAYLIAAPTSFRRRLLHLVAALGAVVASAGWYVALVELWPASSRPYIGGSTNNSLLELALGYNGLGRLLGGAGNGGGGGGSTGFGGSPGITRMFGDAFGAEISWLLPAALIALAGGLWVTRRAPRTDLMRAGLVLWGGWLLVTAGVFSFMSGTVHPYYAVALAPAIAALVALGAWLGRRHRWLLAAMVASTAAWDYVLLTRTPDFAPWAKYVVVVVGAVAAALLLTGRRIQRTLPAAILAATVSLGLGSTAYAASTASQTHNGSIPTSGPTTSAMPGRMAARSTAPTDPQPPTNSSTGSTDTTDTSGTAGSSATSNTSGSSGSSGSSGTAGSSGSSGTAASSGASGASGTAGTAGTAGSSGTAASSGASGTAGTAGSSGTSGTSGTAGSSGTSGAAASSGASGTAGTAGSSGTAGTAASSDSSGFSGPGGVPGGMGGDASASSELTALLSKTTTTWAAATSGSQSAASLELATGKAVIAIGGFSGTDDAPTLSQFQQWVAEGKISYYIAGGQGGRAGGSSAASEIQSWVEANYTASTVGNTTVYTLTS
ncbi:glycosyltransferase family 39 protein [Kribbella sp. NPDC003557]|uniref:ArnT family glycosyltransferase n=1 Tax=Kribbella sp. NPDC003557 TaxID=3154449 RepID=UPI0033B1915C